MKIPSAVIKLLHVDK